jgi:hypothetical protein
MMVGFLEYLTQKEREKIELGKSASPSYLDLGHDPDHEVYIWYYNHKDPNTYISFNSKLNVAGPFKGNSYKHEDIWGKMYCCSYYFQGRYDATTGVLTIHVGDHLKRDPDIKRILKDEVIPDLYDYFEKRVGKVKDYHIYNI